MKNIIVFFIAGAILGAIAVKVLEPSPHVAIAAPVPVLTSEQQAWLGSLEWCESRGTPTAINPKDRDNTPSYGILQFKPGTLIEFSKLYSIATTSRGVMDPTVQEAIVTQMIIRGNINWSHQFPACSHLLGLPPKSPTR